MISFFSSSMESLLAQGQEYVWHPAVGLLSGYFILPEREVELMLATVIGTCFVLLIVNRLLIGSPKSSTECCVTKFFEQRKARKAGVVTIPAGGSNGGDGGAVGAFMHELYGQLASVQKELSILKYERELMDAELIETSTQILQTLGASFIGAFPGDESLISRDGSMGTTPESTRRKIELPTPVMHKPQVLRPEPVVPQPKSPKNTSVTNVVPMVVGAPKTFPKQDASPVNAPVHVPIKPQPAQPVTNEPESKAHFSAPGAPKAEPKMSALAAARLKREAELTHAKSAPTVTVPQATAAAKNPFAANARAGSIPSGPFQL